MKVSGNCKLQKILRNLRDSVKSKRGIFSCSYLTFTNLFWKRREEKKTITIQNSHN